MEKRKNVLLPENDPAHRSGQKGTQGQGVLPTGKMCELEQGKLGVGRKRGSPYLAVFFKGIGCGREVRDDLLTVWAPWVRRDRVTHA